MPAPCGVELTSTGKITGCLLTTGQAATIAWRNGRLCSIEPARTTETPLPWLAPAPFDLQVNGYAGTWFSDECLTVEQTIGTLHSLASLGIGRMLPTVITNSREAIDHAVATIAAAVRSDKLARRVVAGIHLEGPSISNVDGPRGAHPLRHVRPGSIGEFDRWQHSAEGLIRLVTLAPESPGAAAFTRDLVERGVTVAIGHTAADARQILSVIDAGARLSTHLGNGLSGQIHRHHNPLWPQLADDRLTASLIADGDHVPDAFLQTVLRCKDRERIVLTTDLSGWAGVAPGLHENALGRCEMLPEGRLVVAGQRELLAGSNAGPLDCLFHWTQATGETLADAWPLITMNPACLLRLQPPEIKVGMPLELVTFHTTPSSLPVLERVLLGRRRSQADPQGTGDATTATDGSRR